MHLLLYPAYINLIGAETTIVWTRLITNQCNGRGSRSLDLSERAMSRIKVDCSLRMVIHLSSFSFLILQNLSYFLNAES